MSIHRRSVVLLLSLTFSLACAEGKLPGVASAEGAPGISPHRLVTNVAQFRILSETAYLDGCNFRLTGVLTLVDTNRNLVVLQDGTGAVALNFPLEGQTLQFGQLVTLDGTNCSPYFVSFPHYPYRPSGWDVRSSFEAPANWGEYYLTRMCGFLHPPATGEYSFWVASDNSSELWLSTDAHPAKARKIASIPRYQWVQAREWSRFPSQHSEPIRLKAGETYYIEALQEQTTGGDHLSVAWQGPALSQSVIDGRYLTPWSEGSGPEEAPTNGILREYWTNYSAGDLTGLGGARPFESALTVREVCVSIHGPGELPIPDRIALNQPLRAEDCYRWVVVEGVVKFAGVDKDAGFLELSDGQALVQVRAAHWNPQMSRRASNVPVRVQGVCEQVYDQDGTATPGLIWATAKNSISFMETATTNRGAAAVDQTPQSVIPTNSPMQGFYGTRGVVTFDDRVFNEDYIFVQEDAAAVRVFLEDRDFKGQLKVRQWVELGGALEPGKTLPTINPLVVKDLGWHSMPLPLTQPLGDPAPENREGRWSEFEGVVHSVNSNDTLSIVGKDGPAYLWIGQTPSNDLPRYVDAELRARGVLLLGELDAPVLLVPSRDFVDVGEWAPEDPFAAPRSRIADLISKATETPCPRRARVVGEVTYRDARSFFIQDSSGGIRVHTRDEPAVRVGETLEVLGFPAKNGFAGTLTEPLVRTARVVELVKSKRLDLSEAFSSRQSGTLVHLGATLLARKTNARGQVLELQEQQRVFAATLAAGLGDLPDIAPGSRVRITGVCDDETTAAPLAGDKHPRGQFLASLNVLLRSPNDVTVLGGPPWWTLRRTATLAGTLLTVLAVTLLWVHLLRRRLERQQAAQLAFSRQVLERLEDERRRIAVNLHDSLGQILLAIKNHALLAIQRPPDEPGLRKRLDEISGATSQAIEEVRQITHGLRPYQLDRLGLTQAIRASVSRAAANSSILFATRVEHIDGLFDKDAEIHVYRIVQEAVTNVVKHSSATEAAVVIKKRAMVVSLSIRDNGRGFNPAKPSSEPHDLGYGLSGIAERVRILGGTLTIDSRPGEGASLTVEVPLPVCRYDQGSHPFNRG